MQAPTKRGVTASGDLIRHIFVVDSAQTDGRGKTGLGYASFTVRFIRPGEPLSAAITTEDITTIGTYQAPTSNAHIRIKPVSDANLPGVYEVHLHQDWVNATNSCRALTALFTASGAGPVSLQVPLEAVDRQDATAGGLSRIDATISSRASQASLDTVDSIVDAIVAYVDELETRLTSTRAGLLDNLSNLDAAVSSRSSLDAAAVNAEVDAALADILLDKLMSAGLPNGWSTDIHVNSGLAYLVEDGQDARYDRATQSQEIIRQNMATVADVVAGVFAKVLETGFSFEAVMKILVAAIACKCDNFGTSNPKHFRNLLDTKDRITATSDSAGNRLTITFDLT